MQIVEAAPNPADLPVQLCAACLNVLPVDGVGLSLMGGNHVGGRALLGASDAIGARLEDLQFNLGEGPCASAFSDGQPVLVPDIYAADAQARWPMFTLEAQTTPVRAVYAFPLQLGAISLGAMDCYRTQAGTLAEVTEAVIVAETVTLALLQAQARDTERGGDGESQLADLVVGHHAQVHQATGMVSAQLEVSLEEAFVRLRAYAFRHDRSLDEVGADVVARKLVFPHDAR
jgi:hypothetical protein